MVRISLSPHVLKDDQKFLRTKLRSRIESSYNGYREKNGK